MSRQDRQGVRTPADIERKYDFGQLVASQGLTMQQEQRLQQLYQTVSQHIASSNAKFEELENEINSLPDSTDLEGAVRYDAKQELTEEQKAQARENIGAGIPGGGGGTSEGAVRYDAKQELTEEQKAQVRENIGALGTEYVPSVPTVIVKPLSDKKILCLGDSLIGNDRTDGVPSYLAEYTGATVYNGGFGGTFLSIRNSSSPNVCFDLPNLLDAVISGNWSAQETQASLSSFKYFPETVEMLKNLDFNELDAITLSYGTNDWSGKEDSEYMLTHLKESIDKIQLNWPLLRILVITPIWRHFGTADTSSDNYTKYGEGFTLREWSQKIEQAAKEKHISVLNAYEDMPLSLNNIATYFDKDSSTANGFHRTNLNEKGNQIYAQIVCGKLCSMLAPVCASITGGELHKECISAEEIANLSTLLN